MSITLKWFLREEPLSMTSYLNAANRGGKSHLLRPEGKIQGLFWRTVP